MVKGLDWRAAEMQAFDVTHAEWEAAGRPAVPGQRADPAPAVSIAVRTPGRGRKVAPAMPMFDPAL